MISQRRTKDVLFRNPRISPLATVARLKLASGTASYIDISGRQIAVSDSLTSKSVVVFFTVKNRWHWEKIFRAVKGVLENHEIEPGPIPSGLEVSFEKYLLFPRAAGDQLILVVQSMGKKEFINFKGLSYYEPDRDYAVSAEWKHFDKPQKTGLSGGNPNDSFFQYGEISFQLGGNDLKLTAFKIGLDDSDSLFVPFRDATSGVETYEAGRYLEIKEPKEGAFILDFNVAHNPLCNYSPVYACPLPPSENWLEVHIKAGERKYPQTED